MYPHQRDGFEFIWKNLTGGLILEELERMKEYYHGSGCIISHAPGTGKTRLTIVFLQSYMNFQPKCRPVISAPKNMLMTWEEEFRKWNVNVPFHNLNRNDLTGRENLNALRFLQKSMMGSLTIETVRWLKLKSWTLEKSVLGVSYNLFEKLTREKGENVVEEEKSMRNTLFEKSGIVVMDEGHTPRNDESLIWKATSNIKTKKRIILSGTPFQNNFDELHNTFTLVKHGFDVTMYTPQRESTRRGRGVSKSARTRDDWDSLTGSISKNRDIEKLNKLKSLIAPFVHVHKGTILQDRLPGMSHCALYLRSRSLQKQLLGVADTLVNAFQKKHLVTLLSVHSSMLLDVPVTENFELLSLQCDITEAPDETIARYLRGLKGSIADTVELQPYLTFTDVCNLAHEIEKQQSGQPTPRPFAKDTPFNKGSGAKRNPPSNPMNDRKKAIAQFQENKDHRKYFKCQGFDHVTSECPTRRVVTIKELEEGVDQPYDDSIQLDDPIWDKEDEFEEYPDKGELLVIRKALNANPVRDEEDQREIIFYTRCTVKDKVCLVISDGGSCTNVVSTTMEKKLQLSTTRTHIHTSSSG